MKIMRDTLLAPAPEESSSSHQTSSTHSPILKSRSRTNSIALLNEDELTQEEVIDIILSEGYESSEGEIIDYLRGLVVNFRENWR